MPAPNVPLRHSCECLCSACEQQGAGYFAQRAALAGESHAAERLSPSVFLTLSAERGRRRRSLRKAIVPSASRRAERQAHGSL